MAMEFSGEYRIPAPQQQVWDALNNPAVLQTCIAGCQQLERVGDTEFATMVVARVGPISATFRGNVNLTDLDPPNGYTMTGRGQGGAAGFAKMTAQVRLRAEQDDTVLSYTASAEIGGKLASVGSRLVQTVAKKNADDFFAAFAAHFGAGGVAAPTGVAVPGQPQPGPAVAIPASAGSSLAAPVPAWLVMFVAAISFALGYCVALLR